METLGVIALMVNILLFPKFWRKKMLPDTERERERKRERGLYFFDKCVIQFYHNPNVIYVFI